MHDPEPGQRPRLAAVVAGGPVPGQRLSEVDQRVGVAAQPPVDAAEVGQHRGPAGPSGSATLGGAACARRARPGSGRRPRSTATGAGTGRRRARASRAGPRARPPRPGWPAAGRASAGPRPGRRRPGAVCRLVDRSGRWSCGNRARVAAGRGVPVVVEQPGQRRPGASVGAGAARPRTRAAGRASRSRPAPTGSTGAPGPARRSTAPARSAVGAGERRRRAYASRSRPGCSPSSPNARAPAGRQVLVRPGEDRPHAVRGSPAASSRSSRRRSSPRSARRSASGVPGARRPARPRSAAPAAAGRTARPARRPRPGRRRPGRRSGVRSSATASASVEHVEVDPAGAVAGDQPGEVVAAGHQRPGRPRAPGSSGRTWSAVRALSSTTSIRRSASSVR